MSVKISSGAYREEEWQSGLLPTPMQLLGHWPLCYVLTSQRKVILTVRAYAPTPGFCAAQHGAGSPLRLVPSAFL